MAPRISAQTEKPADRQSNRQPTDIQTDPQTDGCTDRQTYGQTDSSQIVLLESSKESLYVNMPATMFQHVTSYLSRLHTYFCDA